MLLESKQINVDHDSEVKNGSRLSAVFVDLQRSAEVRLRVCVTSSSEASSERFHAIALRNT